MLRWKLLMCYVVFVTYINAEQSTHCCHDELPVLRETSRCSDMTKISIACEETIIIPDLPGEFTIDSKNNLILVDEEFTPGNYCLTKLIGKNNKTEDVALICVGVEEESNSWIIRGICVLISCLCLVLTIIVYALVPTLRDLQGKCILNAIIALAAAFLFLGIIQVFYLEQSMCLVMAVMTYFFFMASFLWLNVIAFNKWLTVVKPQVSDRARNLFKFYFLYGYGGALVFLAISLITHHAPGDHIKPEFGNGVCWFSGRLATWAYFYGPISVLLVANIILFAWTAKTLWNDYKQSNSKCKSLKYRFLLYLRLFIIMGLTWIFEVLSYAFEDVKFFANYVWVITDYINALQGVLIFLILVVLRKRALRGLGQSGICCLKFPKKWTTLKDEECEEVDEAENGLAQENTVILQ